MLKFACLGLVLLALTPACGRSSRRKPRCQECGEQVVTEQVQTKRKVIEYKEPTRVSGPRGWGSMRGER